jgi:pseudouridine-5'-phosphate glycosidase
VRLSDLPPLVEATPEVAAALAGGTPVVALESSVLAQGLRPPHNAEAARRMVAAVQGGGAVPAVTAVVAGVPSLGIPEEAVPRFLAGVGVRKCSARDLPMAVADAADGATTVAGALALCGVAGIPVFATGGIGGVHRDAPYDESADLLELARTPALVVCAGAKSILDLPATLERLETLGVPVVGYRTAELPGFFTASTGLPLPAVAHDVATVAAAWRAHVALGRPGAMLVVQPPPPQAALPAEVVEAATREALARAAAEGVRGGAVTPFLLGEVERRTHGQSVRANLALLEANAALAAALAVAVAPRRG